MNGSIQEEMALLSRRGFEFMFHGLDMYCKVMKFWAEYAKLLQGLSSAYWGSLPQQTGAGSLADFSRLQQEQFNTVARSWTDYIKEMSNIYRQGQGAA